MYAGQIIGAPNIIFNEVRPVGSTAALGTLSLIRPATSANVINSIDVQSGVLIGTIAGFGGATLNVAAGAKIGFNNEFDAALAETGVDASGIALGGLALVGLGAVVAIRRRARA